MKSDYVNAFMQVIKDGAPVDTALTGLRKALDRKAHGKLLLPILHEVLRLMEADKGVKHAVVATISTASYHDLQDQIAIALKELGVEKDTPVQTTIDETLVGGFVATYNYQEYDHSYKKALKSLFESITS